MSRKQFQYHPVFGYTFIPGLKARIDHEGGGYLIRVNSHGFRCNHDFAAAKPSGTQRVLLFGDSFTAGDGVSNRDRYGDVLESLLPNLQVYNFGLPGSGTDQQYLTYREIGAGIEHDLVVIAVMVENINRAWSHFRAFADDDGAIRVLAKPYFQLDSDGALLLRHVPPPREPLAADAVPESERPFVEWAGRKGRFARVRKWINAAGPWARDLAQRFSRYQPLPEYDRPDNQKWRLLKAILSHWVGELRMPAIIFPIPLHGHIEETSSPGGYLARFRELSDLAGVTIHDPLPDFHRHPRAARRAFRFERDSHPSPAGHRVLAESLATALQSHLQRKESATPCP